MRKMLVVDDEVEACKALSEFFEEEDYAVFTAYNGESALKIVEKEKPDILLVDIRMPGMNGREVVRRAREMDEKSLIVVVTAIHEEELEKEIESLGAVAVVHKPINLLEIQKLIELRG